MSVRYPIGIDDFKTLRTGVNSEGEHNLYCDKSLFIKAIIDEDAQTVVITRPRRFGKTLNLSMLRYFFDIGSNNLALFANLNITKHTHVMQQWGNQYPVVFLSFKNLYAKNIFEYRQELRNIVSQAYTQVEFMLNDVAVLESHKEKIKKYLYNNFQDSDLGFALYDLTAILYKYYSRKVLVLIDEYDTPIHEAYTHGFYDDATQSLCHMFSNLLKGNEYLYKGVITGIARIGKESLFSGLNNLAVYDITCDEFACYFGFTHDEVNEICEAPYLDDLKKWYNGYIFGNNTVIYNPWSVLSFLKKKYQFAPYWINTSDNALIKASLTVDKLPGIHALIDGKSIDVKIQPFMIFKNFKYNEMAFWNLLFTAGYLTFDETKKMRIPNQEVLFFFETVVLEWFAGHQKYGSYNFLTDLLDCLMAGNVLELEKHLQILILEIMGLRDVTTRTQEAFYHGLLLGISLPLKERYEIRSNRESGYGYYDLAFLPKNKLDDSGIIIEVKIGSVGAVYPLEQIDSKLYATELIAYGCKKILAYGICFDGKRVVLDMKNFNGS
jgi:hypothetical protein